MCFTTLPATCTFALQDELHETVHTKNCGSNFVKRHRMLLKFSGHHCCFLFDEDHNPKGQALFLEALKSSFYRLILPFLGTPILGNLHIAIPKSSRGSRGFSGVSSCCCIAGSKRKISGSLGAKSAREQHDFWNGSFHTPNSWMVYGKSHLEMDDNYRKSHLERGTRQPFLALWSSPPAASVCISKQSSEADPTTPHF